ncbi:MAG: sulfur carrier protein ThiS [Syntrophorhabdales bacterium]|jgi:thiamine biosynthesis protein ThiS
MVTVDGRQIEWREGMTVADLLRELGDSYPYAAVRIEGHVVTGPDFGKAEIPDNVEVCLLPLVAGG